MDAETRDLGLKLAQRRVHLHLSQVQVAAGSGVSHSTIGACERGERLLDDATLGRIGGALGLTPREMEVLQANSHLRLRCAAKNARILANNPAMDTDLSALDDTLVYSAQACAIFRRAVLEIARLPGGGGEGMRATL